MTADDVKRLFALIDTYWPNRLDVGAGHVDAWASALAHYDIDEAVDVVMDRVAAGEKFVPMLADIIGPINEARVPSYNECRPHFRFDATAETVPPAIWAVIEAMGGPTAAAMSGDPDFADARYLRDHGSGADLYASAVPRAATAIARARIDALDGREPPESIGPAPEPDQPPAAGDPAGVVRELSARLRADDRPQEKETP